MGEKGLNRFLSNWKVVFISFLGATTFWFFSRLNKDYSALVSYPIEFEFDQDSVVVMDPLPEVVKVDVASGGWNLFRRTLWFSVTPLKIQLDNPTDIRFLTRSTLLPIVSDQLTGLDVNYLLTDTLFINIEEKVVKPVKIKVDSANVSLDNNFRIVSPIRIEPEYIDLIGPQTIMNSLQEEYYVLVEETRINGNVDAEIDIPLPFEDVMSSNPSTVNVSFEVDRFDRARIIVPVEKLNFPDDSLVNLEDTVVSVSYTIQRSLREGFDINDFGITVDYNMMDEEDSTIQPIMIYYPEIISQLNVSPDRLKVKNER